MVDLLTALRRQSDHLVRTNPITSYPNPQTRMKQFLLFSLLLITATISAQRANSAPTGAEKMLGEQIILPTTVAAIPQRTPGEKLILDTVFAPGLSLACAATPAILGTEEGGFVTGTNGYIDIAKLQRIELEQAYDFQVNVVTAMFFMDSTTIVDQLIDDEKIVAKVYVDNPDGTVGDFLGDSDSIRIGDLGLSNTELFFSELTFSNPVSFTETESFLIGIDFINVYRQPAGDIGIISTTQGCGNGRNAFDVFLDTMNNEVFSTIYDSWNMLDIEMRMGAIIDRDPAVSTRTPNANFSANAFPNPADERLSIRFEAPRSGEYTARLLAPSGQEVRSTSFFANSGVNITPFAVAELPAGVYLFQIQGASGIQTGRVVIK